LALRGDLAVASEVRVEVRVAEGPDGKLGQPTEEEPGEEGEEENGEDGGEGATVRHLR
jgi:hypothetical protein